MFIFIAQLSRACSSKPPGAVSQNILIFLEATQLEVLKAAAAMDSDNDSDRFDDDSGSEASSVDGSDRFDNDSSSLSTFPKCFHW